MTLEKCGAPEKNLNRRGMDAVRSGMWTPSRDSRRGATSIEYALIAMIISIVVMGGSLASGLDLATVFDAVRAAF